MDIRLPDITGYEATRLIKAQKPNLFIIVQTAYATPNDRDKAFESGCDDFLSKPIKREAILTKIKNHIPTSSAEN